MCMTLWFARILNSDSFKESQHDLNSAIVQMITDSIDYIIKDLKGIYESEIFFHLPNNITTIDLNLESRLINHICEIATTSIFTEAVGILFPTSEYVYCTETRIDIFQQNSISSYTYNKTYINGIQEIDLEAIGSSSLLLEPFMSRYSSEKKANELLQTNIESGNPNLYIPIISSFGDSFATFIAKVNFAQVYNLVDILNYSNSTFVITQGKHIAYSNQLNNFIGSSISDVYPDLTTKFEHHGRVTLEIGKDWLVTSIYSHSGIILDMELLFHIKLNDNAYLQDWLFVLKSIAINISTIPAVYIFVNLSRRYIKDVENIKRILSTFEEGSKAEDEKNVYEELSELEKELNVTKRILLKKKQEISDNPNSNSPYYYALRPSAIKRNRLKTEESCNTNIDASDEIDETQIVGEAFTGVNYLKKPSKIVDFIKYTFLRGIKSPSKKSFNEEVEESEGSFQNVQNIDLPIKRGALPQMIANIPIEPGTIMKTRRHSVAVSILLLK